jgi:hypothetical protein
MSTLTGIEAERVSQILRHAIDRLHILSYVPTQWDDDLATGIQFPIFVFEKVTYFMGSYSLFQYSRSSIYLWLICFLSLHLEITCDPVLASLEKQWIAEDQLRLAGTYAQRCEPYRHYCFHLPNLKSNEQQFGTMSKSIGVMIGRVRTLIGNIIKLQ